MQEIQDVFSPHRLINRNFFLLWQGQLVSQMGSAVFHIGILFWIKHTTGSASLMGLMAMLGALPIVIFGPIGGTFADRHSRRAIIITSDILNGLKTIFLAGVLFLLPHHTELIIFVILATSIMGGILFAFFNPAVTAAIPDLVPRQKISGANSLSQFSIQLSTFVGQGVGGVLYRLLGAPMLSLIDGLTFLFSAGSESFIAIPQKIPEKNNGLKETLREFLRDLREGMGYVWQKQGLKQIVIGSAGLNFLLIPVVILIPFYVEDFLKLKADWYGYLMAGFGLGSIGGYLLIGALELTGKRRSFIYCTSLILESVLIGGLALIRMPYMVLMVVFLIGVLNGIINIIVTTILQITTPSQIRGRIFGLVGTIANAVTPLAMGLAGLVADLTGQNIPLIYIICGSLATLLSVILTANKDFRLFVGTEI